MSITACATATGYARDDPTQLTCPCDSGDECYDAAAALDASHGETAEDAEQLMLLAQCACFEGAPAGCNTLAHFAKDSVAACEANRDPADACTIAGLVHLHGFSVPQLNGRSFPSDPAAARAAFARACVAGSAVACQQKTTP